MNVLVPPRVPPDDEIDGLLRAFFRAEVPHPWPAWKAPATPRSTAPDRTAPPRQALWRSRFALAASVAVLALGSLFLPGKAPREAQAPGRPPLSNPEATRRRVAPDNVKSSLSLEQTKDGPTKIKVEVQYLPPMK
jgi:hypothetical protein